MRKSNHIVTTEKFN